MFWDLDNKPPNSFPPFQAAVKLKAAASSFGVVRSMVAYANQHSFSHIPKVVREQRRERKLLNQLENKGVIKSIEPYICKVCGRRFYTNEKLVNHFKQIHEREHQKRLNQIESARGSRRVKLVADELKRAGFWVGTVSNRPQAADVALRDHMVDVMDRRKAECLVLVSDDSDFVGILKTVVVGDADDGALKRVADAGFSWTEILMGKAKKEAVSVVGKWKDRDILKRLEWTYNPEVERKLNGCEDLFDFDDENSCDSGAWWELQ
ncbi:hypothetical protein V6N13_072552 [Hibiscus sabdariffa]|uniref:C2H2-type domain-containing protein n=1 Tax=Hibiscus sabdariffa TaxID=183260 RepID=A0ABR2R7B8_9ROSI